MDQQQQQQQQQQQHNKEQEIVLARVRERQWIYLGPIVAAPVAHICVTLYRSAKTPQAKRNLLVFGIFGSTMLSFGTRLFLMAHAGYPGGSNPHVTQRERLVTPDEKRTMEQPSLTHIAKEAWKGFG